MIYELINFTILLATIMSFLLQKLILLLLEHDNITNGWMTSSHKQKSDGSFMEYALYLCWLKNCTIQYNYGVSASLFLQNIGLSIVLSIHPLTSLTRQNSDRVPHFILACEYMYGCVGLSLPTAQLLTPIRMCWLRCL